MKGKLTQNKGSLQCILPKEYVERYGFQRGDEILFEGTSDGLMIKKKAPRADSDVITIGYEGCGVEDLIDRLKEAGVEQLIDVRELAFSRKKGFSKKALSEALAMEDISYRHMPRLGSPRQLRHLYKETRAIDRFMKDYSSYLDTQEQQLEDLRGFCLVKRSAIMCFEKDFMTCHRRVLSERLHEAGFLLRHL
jgi:uncharacterized protein (DUF488 family)